MSRLARALALGTAAAAALGAGALVTTADASTPASTTVAVPTHPYRTVTAAPWKGTIQPASDPASDCAAVPGNATSDPHAIKITVPGGAGLYRTVSAVVTVSIKWAPSNPSGAEDVNDEILTILDPQGNEIASSDGGSPAETYSFDNPKPGTYTALACGFVNSTPQPYTGTVTIATMPKVVPPGPLSSARGLAFSASVPSDPQRNEAEPAVVTDRDGLIYTCGPNGFSNVADFAQVSTDGGDQFHLLGTSPRGQVSTPPQGGGDCALATAPVKPSGASNYPLAYAGLGPLTGFSTATSTDGGRTLKGSPDSESFPGTDRQWIAFSDATHAFFVYNSTALPGGQTVQRSTDGGFTYEPVGQSVASDGSRVGQIHTILRNSSGRIVADPKQADSSKAVVYFPYTTADSVKLAMSQDGGDTWSQCLAVKSKIDPSAGFPVADNDEAGDIYVTYAEKGGGRDTYLVALPARDVPKCKGTSSDSSKNNVNPGFGPKVRIDRGGVETTVMPWVAAGGAPGRVAVAYYGTRSVGDPDLGSFKASWDVYVDQILDAFTPSGAPNAHPHVAQVKATTHPFHYDSICLNGLGCDISVPAGDRSLADYFTIDYDKKNGRLVLVYDQSYKKPGDAQGTWATPTVVYQIAGPSNGGGVVHVKGRQPVRTSSPDRAGDAIANYSRLDVGGAVPTTPQSSSEEPALDLAGAPAVHVRPEVDAAGKPVANGGFTVTMQLKSLSAADLQKAAQDTGAGDLVYLFRFVNGFQEAGATAHWDPVQGWRFGFDQLTTASPGANGDGRVVLVWPGKTSIKGAVQGNVITLDVPRSVLYGLAGGTGPGQRPSQVKAQAGTRLYDGTAFTLAGPSPDISGNGGAYMQQVDNAPAFDFLVPGARSRRATHAVGHAAAGPGGTTSGTTSAPAVAIDAAAARDLTARAGRMSPAARVSGYAPYVVPFLLAMLTWWGVQLLRVRRRTRRS